MSPSSAATASTRSCICFAPSGDWPYLRASIVAVPSVGSVGAPGSSWKERQCTSTSSAWPSAASALSMRRLPM